VTSESETPRGQTAAPQGKPNYAPSSLTKIAAPVKGLPPVARVLDLIATEQGLATFGPAHSFTYQTFDDNHDRKAKSLARIEHGAITQHVDYFNRLAAKQAGIFFCVAVTDLKGRKTENVIAFRGYWVDLDGASLDPVLKWKLKPSTVTETSPDRYHVFWLFNEPVPVSQLSLAQYSATQLKLAKLFGGDKAVADPPHVARLPGSWHQKSPDAPFQVRVVQGDWFWDDNRYTPDDFEQALGYTAQDGAAEEAEPTLEPSAKGGKGDAARSKALFLEGLHGWSNKPGAFINPRNPDPTRTTDLRAPMVGLLSRLKVAAGPYLADDGVEEELDAKRHHGNAVEPPHSQGPPARVERSAPRVERAASRPVQVRGGGGGYGGRRSGRGKRRWIFIPWALR
jgi:hypothetical protein